MIEKIAVIGAGRMGTGIAHVCALAGIDTVILDVSLERAEQAKQSIAESLERRVARDKMTEADARAVLDRLTPIIDYTGIADCDLVIESITEAIDAKRAIFDQACKVIKPEAILATNTSSISVTKLAANTDRPGKFMGMHFMNPVPVMKLVELIRGLATDEQTYAEIRELTIKLGKIPVNAEDFPAFIVNRVLLPMINEAVYTLYEGVGSVESIDSALKLGANHPMGPLELADFIGLDICLAVMQVLYEGLADTKYRPCPLLVKYVEAGWLGRKSGRGFYDYSGDEPVPTR
ncbi:MAG: 3-hydroxybutyryl-CoA dehydrogenase [Proteobacteria bacterium]|nr:3-hydroxybutyryl-CoA dehydrogenase [Pseudomonadota bacterium]